MHVEAPALIHPQQAPPMLNPHPVFAHHDFQPAPNLPPRPTAVHLESPNRVPSGPTFLMAAPQESPIRLSLPMQMMPHGAQIIQVQQHPHGQPVQVVQRFAGRYIHEFCADT